MDHHRTLHPQAETRPWPEAERRPPYAQRHFLRAEDRLYLGRCPSHIRLAGHVLAPVQCVVPGWHLGTALAGAIKPARCPRPAGMGPGLPGRQFRPGEKRGTAIGKTKVGKGSKVMVVADGQGLPIGLHVDSARPHESQLAQITLATVRVPRPRGRPRTRPKELVADKAYDSREFRRYLRRRASSPPFPRSRVGTGSVPGVGGRSARAPTIATVGRWSVASGGWITVGGWSCGMSALWTITKPSASWPSSCGV
jgi:hypothetical protein